MKVFFLMAALAATIASCSHSAESQRPYVLEITTFAYKQDIQPDAFWAEDALIEATYTSQQPGFISRESGYNAQSNQVVVVVRWEKQFDADASMAKFMEDASVAKYAGMIDGETMRMARYSVDQ